MPTVPPATLTDCRRAELQRILADLPENSLVRPGLEAELRNLE